MIETVTTHRPSVKNLLLRHIAHSYPYSKGRYRLMMLCERFLERREEIVSNLYGKYRFALDLGERGLQSSFYFFIPEYYEFETQKYINETVRPGSLTVDIGAHIGLLTILLADKVGPNGRVFCFEPESKNFQRLRRNVEINGLYWVKPIQMALADKGGGETVLSLSISDSSGHALSQTLSDESVSFDSSYQKVKTASLDCFVEEEKIPKIDLLKIDAEKSEVLILEGGGETPFQRARPQKSSAKFTRPRKNHRGDKTG